MKRFLIIIAICCSIPLSAQKNYLQITFNDGPLKGTHVFTPEKGNYLSQIRLSFDKGVTQISSSKFTSENGLQIHYFTRSFNGEATKGSHKAKKYTTGCGSLNFIDVKNKHSYKRIDGDFSGCTTTTITNIGNWKKTVYKSKRTVSGKFTDELTMKIQMDDGTEKELKTQVKVSFKAIESRRM